MKNKKKSCVVLLMLALEACTLCAVAAGGKHGAGITTARVQVLWHSL
jgi:hypothetical protein